MVAAAPRRITHLRILREASECRAEASFEPVLSASVRPRNHSTDALTLRLEIQHMRPHTAATSRLRNPVGACTEETP